MGPAGRPSSGAQFELYEMPFFVLLGLGGGLIGVSLSATLT